MVLHFFFKIRYKTGILESEIRCSIITYDNLLHTLWEVQIPDDAYWFQDESDIFQRKIDQAYENCKGAVGMADDVQVFDMRKHMIEICMKQWSALEKQALRLVLRNVS